MSLDPRELTGGPQSRNRAIGDLTDEQRRLMGRAAAEELARDEQWLGDRLGPAEVPVPAPVRARVSEAVASELNRQRHRRRISRRWAAGSAVAAALLIGLVTFVVSELLDRGTSLPPVVDKPGEGPALIAKAEEAVDAYVESIDPDEIQLHYELNLLSQELSAPEHNPWNSVVEAIENQPVG